MTEDWVTEIKKRMAKGKVEGFFIYSDGGREIDFMEKVQDKKLESPAYRSFCFTDFLTSFKKMFGVEWKP